MKYIVTGKTLYAWDGEGEVSLYRIEKSIDGVAYWASRYPNEVDEDLQPLLELLKWGNTIPKAADVEAQA